MSPALRLVRTRRTGTSRSADFGEPTTNFVHFSFFRLVGRCPAVAGMCERGRGFTHTLSKVDLTLTPAERVGVALISVHV